MIGGFDVRGSNLGEVSRIEEDRRVVTRMVGTECDQVCLAYVEFRGEAENELHVYYNIFDPYADIEIDVYGLGNFEDLPKRFQGEVIFMESYLEMIDWGTQLVI